MRGAGVGALARIVAQRLRDMVQAPTAEISGPTGIRLPAKAAGAVARVYGVL